MKIKKLNKRGISIMIGYVLLVTFAIIMAAIIYTQLKTYVPTEDLNCPEGTSIFVKESVCSNQQLILTLKNSGRFNIGGYFIHATNNSNQTVATIDLSDYVVGEFALNPGVAFSAELGEDPNSFKPNNEQTHTFNLEDTDFGQIYSIEILPFRWQVEDNKNRVVSCKDSKIKETITC